MPHGGDLAAWAGRYGRPLAEWLDLSTGINPVAYPLPDLAAETWTKLPQSAALAALKEAAATAYAPYSDYPVGAALRFADMVSQRSGGASVALTAVQNAVRSAFSCAEFRQRDDVVD